MRECVFFIFFEFMNGNVIVLGAGWRIYFQNYRACIIEKKEGGLNRG